MEALHYIEGYAGNQFKPFQNINRAEFLKLVMTAAGMPTDPSLGRCFPDVTTEWFAPYVCKAVQLGVVKGYPDGKFRAGQSINMVEGFAIASKAFDLSIKAPTEGQQWFEPYVDFFHDNTIFSKYAYWPDRPMRREEMAFLMDQLVQFKEGKRLMTSIRNPGSAGCGKRAPEVAPTKFMVNGVERTAITVIPKNYDPNKPTPIIFAFHGRTNSNDRVRSYYGLERNGAATNAIILYPAGNKTGSTYNWSNSYPFYDEMILQMKNSYCVNVDQIYVLGHSLGAWFANDLACARGDQIRAVASLGGGRSENKCTGPAAAMLWHNPKDSLAPFSGGEHARDLFLTQNRSSKISDPTEPSWAHCVRYRDGDKYAPVVWCPHTQDYESDGTYYTHVWPKGTGQEMWKFFQSLT